MRQQQQLDKTLDNCMKMASAESSSDKENPCKFVWQKGLLYRRYSLPSGRPIQQLVIPHPFRHAVMRKAHEGIPGHHGFSKTSKRILREFYWPNIYADLRRFLRTCQRCKTANPKREVGIAISRKAPTVGLCLTESLFSSKTTSP
ncbi:hypothetical protein HPB48_014756 [Haemaphysalis longicornis]|uniref:RNA-directed DNA polymerase n=1 Tax=Haemaphysalis longicornis TaxID=44386 RepID=A0A9J6FXQ5_HAELO|nr:hypothetical protein HPB48_014756 [Haemaphysalis longicornis]